MLKVYYGRESQDKEGFLFERIAEVLNRIDKNQDRVVLIVPDQYTLQAERNAIAYLKVNGLIDLEILSQGRLADRILSETGGSARVPIDKQGRQMLLSKILSEESQHLNVFQGMERFSSFVGMTNDLISEMKQYNADLPRLAEVIYALDEKSLLSRKLKDIYRLYERYEREIEGKYTDSEDFIKLLLEKIPKSRLVKNSEFWVFGFESFSPQTIRLLTKLEQNSKGVGIVLTGDDAEKEASLFALCEKMKKKLSEAVGSQHFSSERITKERPPVAASLAHLEQTLFSHPAPVYRGDLSAVTLCKAANYYSEAESAAAYITDLLREKDFRYRDIAVICNDLDVRGSVIKRVFAEYGLRFFMDEKRGILHDPIVGFLNALLAVVTDDYLYEDVFLLLKTDLAPFEQEEYESLENYALRYRIRGNRWKKDFSYGEKEFGAEELARLNELRKRFVEWIGPFELSFTKALTVGQKTEALLHFLTEEANLPPKIEALTDALEEEGNFEAALELSQIWESIQNLFAQFGELMNERNISKEDYRLVLEAGFASLELGLIPPTIDEIVVGTMSRTRVGPIKALVVLGANDGVLPAGAGEDDLLSRDERSLLLGKNIEICKEDDLRMMEERLAIYKNLSKPKQYLWLGYSTADPEGKEIRPSIILNKFKKIFPDMEVEKDILNREIPLALIERPKSTIKHLTAAFLEAGKETRDTESVWNAALSWYRKKEDPCLHIVSEAMSFSNRVEKLDAALVKKLFQKGDGDLTLSPSRIEKFSRCPFAHLVLYGLSPEELRVFEVAGREVGDVYHECLMLLAQSLDAPGKEITDPTSPWMSLSEIDCKKMISGFVDRVSGEYREGVLLSGEEERYRTERMKEICAKAAYALVRHVQQGQVRKIYFEESFGQDEQKTFPAITVDLGEERVLIEGKIDRADLLENGYVKIIDYKSGKEHFDAREAKGGWRLQLMLYLSAAIEGMKQKGEDAKPAGVFYFEIADPLVDATLIDAAQLSEKLEKEMRKAFKLDGIVVNEASVIRNMAGEFTGYSEILPIHRDKEGEIKGTTEDKLLSPEQFAELQETVQETVKRLCGELVSGVADVHPKKTRKETACDFCRYKSICNFELSFDGCQYDVVI